MARPRLYFTPEQKAAADRRKALKYYNECVSIILEPVGQQQNMFYVYRHKKVINRQRRKERRQARASRVNGSAEQAVPTPVINNAPRYVLLGGCFRAQA